LAACTRSPRSSLPLASPSAFRLLLTAD
jgi:hypothetical protein